MIVGAHAIVYSKDPEADRALLRDVLGLPYVDVGDGWLIFGLPPAELAVHPSTRNDLHELYLMCEDAAAFVGAMKARGVSCSPPENLGWGVRTMLSLPGGGRLGVYQPRHARPKPMAARRGSASPRRRTTRARPRAKAPAGKPRRGTSRRR